MIVLKQSPPTHQAVLKLIAVHLYEPSKCWDCRQEPPHPVYSFISWASASLLEKSLMLVLEGEIEDM